MKAPVVLILFNRPELTQKVFNRIAGYKPEKLFLIADGPREGNDEDLKKCEQARKVVDHIDWECKVFKNYSAENMGCGMRPASGVNWVFEHVERCIILEDDCVPEPSFFLFCEELLEKYKDDKRIMQINGINYQLGEERSQYSYFYFRFPLTSAGWATWKRAWKYNDFKISHWSDLRETDFLEKVTRNKDAAKYLRHNFDSTLYSKNPEKLSWWDYQWTFSFLIQHGLSVSPNKDLVSNIGFGEDATHTKNKNNPLAFLSASDIKFPLSPPPFMVVNEDAHTFFMDLVGKKIKNLKKKKAPVLLRIRNKTAKTVRALINRFTNSEGNKIYNASENK
ncbi:MAG: glycosyltransferase family 2 protein [Balneolaceae bacterium]